MIKEQNTRLEYSLAPHILVSSSYIASQQIVVEETPLHPRPPHRRRILGSKISDSQPSEHHVVDTEFVHRDAKSTSENKSTHAVDHGATGPSSVMVSER